MKYNILRNTGLLVSELCLGVMTFGGKGFWKVIGTQSQKEAAKPVRISLDNGINFFDNSNKYSEGLSDLSLSETEMDLFDKVRQIPVPLPDWMVESMAKDRLPSQNDEN